MKYETWRVQFQSGEQAARAAFNEWMALATKSELDSVRERAAKLVEFSQTGDPEYLQLPLKEKQIIWQQLDLLHSYIATLELQELNKTA